MCIYMYIIFIISVYIDNFHLVLAISGKILS